MKLSQIRKARARGHVSSKEWKAICNMMGRGLKTSIDDVCIEFYNGGKKPVAMLQRGDRHAKVYASACRDEAEVKRYHLGLAEARYDISRC